VLKPPHAADDVAFEGARIDEVTPQVGKELPQSVEPAREQAVTVTALRDAAAMRRGHRQDVAIDDGDASESRAEDTRGHEAGDAAADDERVLTEEM
jgi:hypothetical protein